MNARLRHHARALLRPVYHRLLQPLPHDTARRWRGTAELGEHALRVAYFGDCSFRAMDRSHGVHGPIGWPSVLGERLRARGQAMEFSAVFVAQFEHLSGRDGLWRYLRLSGDPDVVFIQLGGLYARRVILPDSSRYLRLREDIARKLGDRVFAGYRLLRPLVRVFGHSAVPYLGAAGLERFLRDACSEWPQATVVLLLPFPREPASPVQSTIEAQVRVDALAAAESAEVETLDLAGVVVGPERLRCANGYNLNTEGSRRVGEHLADWLSRRRQEADTAPDIRSVAR